MVRLPDLGYEGLCLGQAPMGKLNIHGYIKLCKNGGVMKLPSPDLILSKWVCRGKNPYGGEIISGHDAEWGGWARDLSLPFVFAQAFLAARLIWCQKGSFIHQHRQLLMWWRLFLFFPFSGPPCLWCIPKSPADYFPLSLRKFWMRWKKKENSFLCCRNDKGNSFHMCPGTQIVKTDFVLSPSHRCGCFFSREVRQRELNKLIWVSLAQAFLVRTYWGEK